MPACHLGPFTCNYSSITSSSIGSSIGGGVAQLGEQRTSNPQIWCSSPGLLAALRVWVGLCSWSRSFVESRNRWVESRNRWVGFLLTLWGRRSVLPGYMGRWWGCSFVESRDRWVGFLLTLWGRRITGGIGNLDPPGLPLRLTKPLAYRLCLASSAVYGLAPPRSLPFTIANAKYCSLENQAQLCPKPSRNNCMPHPISPS